MEDMIRKIHHDNNWSSNCSTLFNATAVVFAISGIIAGKLFGIGGFNVLAMIFVWTMSIFPLFIISAIKNHFKNQEALILMISELNGGEYSSQDKYIIIKTKR